MLSFRAIVLMAACASLAASQDIFSAVRQDSQELIKKALAGGADINQRQPGALACSTLHFSRN
eukprot:SAG31_NODE_46_length_30980_cov_226.095107_5_plen_63_part_00